MSYIHLTTTERVKIETYLELGMSIRSIARRLGRQPSTVSREIRRNPDYVAERARTVTDVSQKADAPSVRTMAVVISREMLATRSPFNLQK